MKQIILASASPRRKYLMMHLGIPFKVVASNYHEVHHKHLSPADLVKFLAAGKAKSVAKKYQNAIIIGADTIVVQKGKIFGKPQNKQDALRILRALSNSMHYVYTGICIIDSKSNKKQTKVVKVKVFLRKLNLEGLKNYIATGEPMDKAAGYAAQGIGAGLIRKILGEYTNVIGLPLDTVLKMLRKFGLKFKPQ